MSARTLNEETYEYIGNAWKWVLEALNEEKYENTD